VTPPEDRRQKREFTKREETTSAEERASNPQKDSRANRLKKTVLQSSEGSRARKEGREKKERTIGRNLGPLLQKFLFDNKKK